MRDPYKVLGIPRSANADAIKAAYRRLVKQYHPDRHPDDKAAEQRFKEIQSAYDLLGNAEKRARFDRNEIDAEGHETVSPFERAARASRNSRWKTRPNPSIFEEFFARHDIHTKGADVSYDLQIEFLEAVRGGKHAVHLQQGGSVQVTIPEGTEDGDVLRLRGRGTGGFGGGQPGDALVRISVSPHAHYVRKGADIHLDVPVTLREAVLGASIEVPTPHGRVTLKVPHGSNSGRVLRLKGKGTVDRKTNTRGDFYVRLVVTIEDAEDPELSRFLEGWSPRQARQPRSDLADL
ncbi:MAG: DnaJ domain-containing protein [Rhodospirillaceae bacterium]|nr:DnaJ domain-containing protein [Rhodospirillaceae bacterium]